MYHNIKTPQYCGMHYDGFYLFAFCVLGCAQRADTSLLAITSFLCWQAAFLLGAWEVHPPKAIKALQSLWDIPCVGCCILCITQYAFVTYCHTKIAEQIFWDSYGSWINCECTWSTGLHTELSTSTDQKEQPVVLYLLWYLSCKLWESDQNQ